MSYSLISLGVNKQNIPKDMRLLVRSFVKIIQLKQPC
jgi:hypothetical protein